MLISYSVITKLSQLSHSLTSLMHAFIILVHQKVVHIRAVPDLIQVYFKSGRSQTWPDLKTQIHQEPDFGRTCFGMTEQYD